MAKRKSPAEIQAERANLTPNRQINALARAESSFVANLKTQMRKLPEKLPRRIGGDVYKTPGEAKGSGKKTPLDKIPMPKRRK